MSISQTLWDRLNREIHPQGLWANMWRGRAWESDPKDGGVIYRGKIWWYPKESPFFHRSFSHMKVLVKITFHPWVDSPLPSCQPSMPSKGLWHPPLESPLVITRLLDWHLALPGVVVIWDHPSSPLGSTNENSLIWGPWLLAHLGDVKPQCLRWACLQKIQHSLPCFLTTPCLRSQGWWETRETENRLFTLWHWAPWHVLVQFSSVQSLSRVQLFVIPWIAACQASLSITNSQSLLKLMSIQSVMPSSHLILCRPFLLLPPIPPSIRVFSNESSLRVRWPKYWSFSFNISRSNEHPGLISFRMDWLDLLAVQGTLKSLLQHHSSKASILVLTACQKPFPLLLFPFMCYELENLTNAFFLVDRRNGVEDCLLFHKFGSLSVRVKLSAIINKPQTLKKLKHSWFTMVS